MSVERATIDAWGMSHSLCELVPAAHVYHGTAKGKDLTPPYVTVNHTATPKVERTSHNLLETCTVVTKVFDSDPDRAVRIANAMYDWFNRGNYDSDDIRVLDWKPLQFKKTQGVDGLWAYQLDWQVRTARVRGEMPVGA